MQSSVQGRHPRGEDEYLPRPVQEPGRDGYSRHLLDYHERSAERFAVCREVTPAGRRKVRIFEEAQHLELVPGPRQSMGTREYP